MNYAWIPVLCHLLYAFTIVMANDAKERNCPSANTIKPCMCSMRSRVASLICKNIESVETLRNIFQNAKRHVFRQVWISSSSLAYLPHEMFSWTTIGQLSVSDTTMIELFDENPAVANSISNIVLSNLELQRHIFWDQLKAFTGLKNLNVQNVHIKILGEAFRKNVNNHLEYMDFKGTGTRKIMPGTLVPFRYLQRVSFIHCKLTSLTRNVFPSPFNVKFLMFSDNNISEIPEDLFTNMPRLMQVSLDKNNIKTLPKSAFEKSVGVYYIDLNDNPLECDCRIEWILKKARHFGSCKNLDGKSLSVLTESELNCKESMFDMM